MKLLRNSIPRAYWFLTGASIVLSSWAWLVLDETLPVSEMSSLFRPVAQIVQTIQAKSEEWIEQTSLAPKQKPNYTVIIEIDSDSIEQYGRWPWHRDTMAKLLDGILKYEPKSVSMDIVFSEADPRIPPSLRSQLEGVVSTDLSRFETDPRLATLLGFFSDKVVLGLAGEGFCLGEKCEYQTKASSLPLGKPAKFKTHHAAHILFPLGNLPIFTQPDESGGFLVAGMDSDGIVRKFPLFINAVNAGDTSIKTYPSLGLATLEKSLGNTYRIENDPHGYPLFATWPNLQQRVPLSKYGFVRPKFLGPAGSIPYIKAQEILAGTDLIRVEDNGKIIQRRLKDLLKDKSVFIGVTAVGVNDIRAFPLDLQTPGVEGHATLVESTLSGTLYRSYRHFDLRTSWGIAGIILLGLIIHLSISTLSLRRAFSVFGLTLGGLIGVHIFLNSLSISFPTISLFGVVLSTFFGLGLYRYFEEERSKKFIQSAFSRYLSPKVVEDLIRNPKQLQLGGEKKHLAMLFSDIRGFTSFSEQLDAKHLVSLLNEYLGAMTQKIQLHKGTLDKYIGDAIMAFFGAPITLLRPEEHALKSALDMLDEINRLKPIFKQKYNIELDVGLGIHCGTVHVGNLGSEQVFSYTIIGDHVNLASRIESLTKSYGVSLLVSESVLDRLTPQFRQSLGYRLIDEVIVKGKKDSVRLYHVRREKFEETFLDQFNEARNLYIVGKFSEAEQAFLKLQKEDPVARVFADRCKTIPLHRNPKEDWTGVWLMKAK